MCIQNCGCFCSHTVILLLVYFFQKFHLSKDIHLYGRKLSRERESLSQPSQLYCAYVWEKRWPFSPRQQLALVPALICLKQRSRILWLSHFDQVDPAGRAKVFIKRNANPASCSLRAGSLARVRKKFGCGTRTNKPACGLGQEGDPINKKEGWGSPFCKEMYEKLARPGTERPLFCR